MKTAEELAQEIIRNVWMAMDTDGPFTEGNLVVSILPILTAHELERQKEANASADFWQRKFEVREKENADLRALVERMHESLLEVSAQDGCYCSPSVMKEVRACVESASAILK